MLSDAAGVQKNISKMYEDYAKSIGKSTDSLTQAEKAQAVYNGIMDEASMFAGSAAEMAQGYQGVQAQLNATNLELSRTIGVSMIPTLTQYSSLQLSITKVLAEFISNHKGATSGVITFTTTLLAMIVALTAGKKAYIAYKDSAIAATIAQEGFTKALMSNPITAIAVVVASLAAGISTLTTVINENKEAQEKLNEVTETYKQLQEGTYGFTEDNISSMEQRKQQIEEQIKLYQKMGEAQQEYEKAAKGTVAAEIAKDLKVTENGTVELTKSTYELKKQLDEAEKAFKDAQKENGSYGKSLDELNDKLEDTNKYLNEANAIKKISKGLDTETIKIAQQEAAQLKINAQTMQDYLNTVKQGQSSTSEYQEAVKRLSEAYPEAANAEGIIIERAQDLINAEQLKADTAWGSAQTTIQSYIDIINAALQSESTQRKIAENIGIAYEELQPKLEGVLGVLQTMAGYQATDVPSIKPVSISTPKRTKASSSSSYSNKKLDNYKKEIEYKKSLDQLSLQQEINMYETALRKYAKTTDEKRELTTKIYELQKELQEKELDDYISNIEYKKSLDKLSTQEEIKMYEYAYNSLAKTTEQKRELEVTLHELRKELSQANEELIEEQKEKLKEQAEEERNILNQRTKDYERYIKNQENLRGAEYDVVDRKNDLDKIIKIHQDYLKQILKDERYSLEERKSIYEEELDIIRSYEEQKRDLRVKNIDNTVNQLKSAITKQLEEMQEADKEAINKNIELVEKWKETRIEAINEEYDARIYAINKELEALDKAEQQKTRDEEDAEYEKKKKRLEELVAFEHDTVTKINYQKELNKLIEEHQKALNKRTLEDKKEALNAQKDLLKEEQNNKVQAIEDEAKKQKEVYDKQQEELEKYYDKQKELAQETAEKMLLNIDKNQKQILNLLKKYEDKYEITGQSLGEKLAQGINNGLAGKIEGVIQKIQDKIDSAIENQIAKIAGSSYKYTVEVGKSQASNKTVNVTQNNYIEQNPEMPSETHRKLNDTSQKLAQELAGI